MTSATDQARDAAAIARADVDREIKAAGDAFRATLDAALTAMFEATVMDQSRITEDMDAAERATFKFNLEQARADALAGVDTALSKLGIEFLAKKASRSLQGGSYIIAGDILSPLLKNYGDLLASKGYRLVAFKSGASTYSTSNAKIGDVQADVAAQQISRAIEKYGHAKHALEDAEAADGKARVRDLWNQS